MIIFQQPSFTCNQGEPSTTWPRRGFTCTHRCMALCNCLPCTSHSQSIIYMATYCSTMRYLFELIISLAPTSTLISTFCGVMSHMRTTAHVKFLKLNTLPYSSKHMHLVLHTCIKKWEFNNNLSQPKPFSLKVE
jgi:hypothetical protein